MTNTKPITSWYYDYYEPGTFPSQSELCKAVQWTNCNLEGQRLRPPNSLTGEHANPLTIRLFGIKEALNRLEEMSREVNEKIEQQSRRQFDKGKIFGMGISRTTSSSTGVITGGAAFDELSIDGDNNPLAISHVKIHLTLYELFNHFSSILDRLSFEINKLYNLGIIKIDWVKLTDMNTGKNKHWESLSNKDKAIADHVRGFSNTFTQALKYRNRLVHDGVIRIDTDIKLLKFYVMLSEDPNNDTSKMNVNAIEFCKEVKINILKLLNGSYAIMFKHLKSFGNPPW